jgi:hypothetical protein
MDPIVFDEIPFELRAEEVAPRLHIEPDTDSFAELEALVREAVSVARPKAVCTMSFIGERGDDFVVLDGVCMESRVMPGNLKSVHRVFPYVATCGEEVEAWSYAIRDPLLGWWADAVKIELLHKGIGHMNARLRDSWKLGKLANMNPGSLPDWPITEQPKLFSLLGDVKAAIGVTLTGSMLMLPTKSVSGIYFETESGYENCELCTRKDCPGRRKLFDREKHDALLVRKQTE